MGFATISFNNRLDNREDKITITNRGIFKDRMFKVIREWIYGKLYILNKTYLCLNYESPTTYFQQIATILNRGFRPRHSIEKPEK